MYIITGIGRSGTSFIAELFHNLDYDMGSYNKEMDAGFENSHVTQVNKLIMSCENTKSHNFATTIELYSKEIKIAKDPRFLFTIGHWIFLGAKIDAVFYCTRRMRDIIESSDVTGAGNMSILKGFDDGVKIQTFMALERGFKLLCSTVHIPVFDIRFPESLVDFNEVRCLDTVVGNLETLREVWERTRRIPQC